MASARGCIAGACAYSAWVALTDSAKRSITGGRTGSRPCSSAARQSWRRRALGARADDAAGVAAVRAGRAGGSARCHRTGRTRRARSCSGCRSSPRASAAADPRRSERACCSGTGPARGAAALRRARGDARDDRGLVRAGCVVALNPGDPARAVATDSAQEQVFANRRLGFLRLALEHRCAVVPMYGFGENQVYTAHPRGCALRAAPCAGPRRAVVVSGRWGLSAGVSPLLPNPTRVTHVVGRAVDVGGAARARRARDQRGARGGVPALQGGARTRVREAQARASAAGGRGARAPVPPPLGVVECGGSLADGVLTSQSTKIGTARLPSTGRRARKKFCAVAPPRPSLPPRPFPRPYRSVSSSLRCLPF